MLVLAALAALTAVAISAAAVGGGQAELVQAQFDVNAVQPPAKKRCQGPDGNYQRIRGTYSGSISSISPVLTGRLRLTLETLLNLDKGLGSAKGTWSVVDPGTAQEQASGKLNGLFVDQTELHGFLVGEDTDGRAVLGQMIAFTDQSQSEYVGRIGDLTPHERAVLLPAAVC